MKRLLIGGIAALGLVLGPAPLAQAGDIDCFTQETYDGSRTTCYYGYPDYQRSITDCNGSRCTTRWA